MKQRLDIAVSEKLKISRAKAQALIMAGEIFVDGKMSTKAGENIDVLSTLSASEKFPYVSRGASKLEKAVQEFKIDLSGLTICDIGSSTGGFTDYSLQNGGKIVYAIDSGYGQLDQKLRNDNRVISMERTNIKAIDALPEKIDLFVIDVSFISLKKVLPQCIKIQRGAPVVALIKPQFEVGKLIADKTKGVIRDEKIHQNVVEDISVSAESLGYNIAGVIESPITGAKGNKEFLIYLN